MDGVKCFLTCQVCGETERTFEVRYREPGEDLGKWLATAVRPAMGAAHRAAQPHCPAETADLGLPAADGAHGVGMRVVQ